MKLGLKCLIYSVMNGNISMLIVSMLSCSFRFLINSSVGGFIKSNTQIDDSLNKEGGGQKHFCVNIRELSHWKFNKQEVLIRSEGSDTI